MTIDHNIIPFIPKREPRFTLTDSGNIYDALTKTAFIPDEALELSQVLSRQADELAFRGSAFRAASMRLRTDQLNLFDVFDRATRRTVGGLA